MSDIAHPENPARLDSLIRRYCADAEAALGEAPDYASALRLKETLCSQFAGECESSLVVNATREYIDALLKGRWPAAAEEG